MGSHISMISAAEIPAVELLQADQELVVALLDLYKDVPDNQELSELLHIYYINTVRTRELSAALQQHLDAIHEAICRYQEASDSEGALNLLEFFHDLYCLYRQQLLMRETLQWFDSSSTVRSVCVHTLKKVSAVFFTAAAAISAAAAAANVNPKRPELAASAAAASIVLGAVGNWVHSRLKKRETVVKKQKELINVMIVGERITMDGLSNIFVSARRLEPESESASGMLDDDDDDDGATAAEAVVREKLAGYCRDVSWVRALVVHTIIKHVTNSN